VSKLFAGYFEHTRGQVKADGGKDGASCIKQGQQQIACAGRYIKNSEAVLTFEQAGQTAAPDGIEAERRNAVEGIAARGDSVKEPVNIHTGL